MWHDQLVDLRNTDADTIGSFRRPYRWKLFTNGQHHLLAKHGRLLGYGQLLLAQFFFQQFTFFAAKLARLLCSSVARRERGDADGWDCEV